jgi:hypothetical protein
MREFVKELKGVLNKAWARRFPHELRSYPKDWKRGIDLIVKKTYHEAGFKNLYIKFASCKLSWFINSNMSKIR